MIKISFTFISLLIITSCSQYKYTGTYKSDYNVYLELNSKNFLLIDKTDIANYPFKCCDTISYGNWKKESNNLLSLTTPNFFDTYYVHAVVNESHIAGDSIVFHLDNPIEKHYSKYNEKNREFYYLVELSSNNADFDVRLAQKKWESNSFKIYKPKDVVIDKFEIVIVPKSDMRVRSIEAKTIYTMPYSIKDSNSNNFYINIPLFTYQYVSLKRMRQELIRIEGDKIIWNGKYFQRNSNLSH